jgi:hypothetical protein
MFGIPQPGMTPLIQLGPLLGGVIATFVYQFSFAANWGEGLTAQYRIDEEDDVSTQIDRTVPQDDADAPKQYTSSASQPQYAAQSQAINDYDSQFDPELQQYAQPEVKAHSFDYK